MKKLAAIATLGLAMCLLHIAFGVSSPVKASERGETATVHVREMLERMDTLSQSSSVSEAQMARAFGEIASAYFDLSAMARATLASKTRRLTAAQWAGFRVAYARHLGLGFVAGVRKFGASRSEILGARGASAG